MIMKEEMIQKLSKKKIRKKFGVIPYGNYLAESFLFPSSVINPS